MTCLQINTHQLCLNVCVFCERGLTGNGSYEVMCWTVEKEIFTGLLEYSEWLPGRLLLCAALWKVVNLCHLGTVGCGYHWLLCVCGITPWMSHMWVFPCWLNLCGTIFASHLSSLGDICIYKTCVLHLVSTPAYTSFYLTLTLAKYSRFPTEIGSRRACPTHPIYPLGAADITALFPSDTVRHINNSRIYVFFFCFFTSDQKPQKDLLAHIQTQACLQMREMLMISSWQMEWGLILLPT